MDELSLGLRLCIGSIFIGTFIDKIQNFISHMGVVRSYRIVPENILRPLVYVEITLELIIGIGMILGIMVNFMNLIAAFLLSLYAFAMIVNLIRGNYDLSCGCGGILGDSKISWKLVIRNIVFLLVVIFMNYSPHELGSVDTYLKLGDISVLYNESVLYIVTTFVLLYAFILVLRAFARLND